MGSMPRGPFTDQLTQPVQPPRLPADNQAAMAGWGGPFAAITQFATSFLRGASEGRQAQREQAEQQRARNIAALQSLGQQVEQSGLIPTEKEAIQRDIGQRLFAEIANTKAPDKKNASPIFNFVTQTAKNLLGPGAPKVKPLDESALGEYFMRMQSGKTVDSVRKDALMLLSEAMEASRDSHGYVNRERLFSHPKAFQSLKALTDNRVEPDQSYIMAIRQTGVTAEEASRLGILHWLQGPPPGQPQGQRPPLDAPPAAPGGGQPEQPQSPLMLAANQFAGVDAPQSGSGPLQALTQMATGPLPWHTPQQGAPAQPQSAPGQPPVQTPAPSAPPAPQASARVQPAAAAAIQAQGLGDEDSDTNVKPESRAILGQTPPDTRQIAQIMQIRKALGMEDKPSEYYLARPQTGEWLRVRDYGIGWPVWDEGTQSYVPGQKNARVEIGSMLPIVGEPEQAGFRNTGNTRPQVPKPGLDQEELAREVASVNMHIDAMAKDYPELVESYKTQVRLASLSPSDPAGKLRQVVKDMETAIDRREQAKDRRIAQANAAAARGDIQTQTRLMRGSIELGKQAEKIERRESMKAYSIIARHARTAHAAIADKDGAKTGRYDKDMIAGLRDLAMVNMAALITDYNSTVRDGERKMWLEAQGYWQKVSANLRAFTTGDGTMLTPETRRAVIDLVDRMERSVRDYAVRDISPMVKSVKRIAKTHGVDDYSLDELLPPDLLSSFEKEFGRDLGKVKADQSTPSNNDPYAVPSGGKGEPPKPTAAGTPRKVL